MTEFAILFTMAAIGVSETAYLVRQRIIAERPVCPMGGGCVTVLSSGYNRIFGVHNDLLGMVFYIAMCAVTAFLVIGVGPSLILTLSAALMLTGATIMSAYFFLLQWRVIKAWCFWCLMSAVTIVVMDAVILFSLRP
jgi:uncharacterized membrane protein